MPVEPTQLVLDGKAEYFQDGDTVLVVVYLVDPELEMGFPGLVISGTCSLMYRNQTIRSISFDRRFGNGEGAEGDFILQFSHPPVTTGMSVKLEITTSPVGGDSEFARIIPVTLVKPEGIPLQGQSDSREYAQDELRSRMRIEEEI